MKILVVLYLASTLSFATQISSGQDVRASFKRLRVAMVTESMITANICHSSPYSLVLSPKELKIMNEQAIAIDSESDIDRNWYLESVFIVLRHHKQSNKIRSSRERKKNFKPDLELINPPLVSLGDLFCIACSANYYDLIAELIQQDPSLPLTPNEEGLTPLHIAANCLQTKCISAILEKCPDKTTCANTLRSCTSENGFSLPHHACDGSNSLFYALTQDSPEISKCTTVEEFAEHIGHNPPLKKLARKTIQTLHLLADQGCSLTKENAPFSPLELITFIPYQHYIAENIGVAIPTHNEYRNMHAPEKEPVAVSQSPNQRFEAMDQAPPNTSNIELESQKPGPSDLEELFDGCNIL